MTEDLHRPRRSAQGRDLGDEYLVYDRESEKVHLLNESARQILLLCDGTRDTRAVVTELTRIYGIDREEAERDLQELMVVFKNLGLVTFSGESPEESDDE